MWKANFVKYLCNLYNFYASTNKNAMKKILTLLILICFFSQSCKNDDDNHVCTCAVSNPIEDLN